MRSEFTQPQAATSCQCCTPPIDRVVECDDRTILIRNRSGLILAPRRHVLRWRDLSETEQAAVVSRIAPAQALLEPDRAAATVKFIETEEHFHIWLEAPTASGPIPGAPHDRALISGGEDTLARPPTPLD